MNSQNCGNQLTDVSHAELVDLFDLKYRHGDQLGPDPARRLRYGYFNPDDYYEAVVRREVNENTRWLDIGCGRDLFPSNRPLARELSDRCARLVGVDPDATIHENAFVHERVQGMIEDLPDDQQFDLVTMRMVAEHVAKPEPMLATLARLVVAGGLVIVYTINRWSPVPVVTAATPFRLHNPIKYVLWRTEAKDTFPTTYKMNTHDDLRRLFTTAGFTEVGFRYLDDCRTFQRFRALNILELNLRSALHRFNIRYPENCLLGVYRRHLESDPAADPA